MRKIIKRRVCDTETAQLIGTWTNGLYVNDLDYMSESLYRNRGGRAQEALWFIHGEGGARTRYSKRDGSGWAGGEDIFTLTQEEAEAWAEEHLTADEIEAAFTVEPEDVGRLEIRLSPELIAAVKEAARERGVSVSAFAANALRQMMQ